MKDRISYFILFNSHISLEMILQDKLGLLNLSEKQSNATCFQNILHSSCIWIGKQIYRNSVN